MPRFVVLHHVLPEGSDRASHWDLMLEHGDALRTWALDDEPRVPGDGEALLLADHRLAYLEYQGPVSGDRGSVSRWDEGRYEPLEVTDARWLAELAGTRLRGTVLLERAAAADAHSWRVSFGTAPTSG